MPINYRDFDLLIEQFGDTYKARVVDSPAGEAVAAFKLPFSLSDVEQFFVQIGHTRLIESPQTQKMREFGQLLFEATFTGDVRDRLRESLNEVTRRGEGLRIRLRTGNLPELTNLPWEFMYDASLGRFLALSIETPLVRYLDIPRDIQPLSIRPPLRILAMISSPRDFPTLNVQKEWENLQESLSKLESRGLVALTRLERPTLQMLQRQLRREQYHIFHFIGHGVFSKQYQDGFLLFEDELQAGHRVSSRDLGILLHDHPHLRLAVLNACEGARISLEDQFSGTAQNLMQQGLPAVIAMQFRITDIAAITLAREFYAALADGYPVDAALTEARKAIKTHGNDLEWGTPVLYMRAPNGQIFDVESMPSTEQAIKPSRTLDPERLERIERLYTEALEAYYLENWALAQQTFQAVLDEDPEHEDAVAKLEIAKRKAQLLTLHEQAKTSEAAGDWERTIEILESLVEKDPNFENAKVRLARVRREKQLNDLYEEAQRLTKAEKWQAVLGVFTEIDMLAPKYPDPQNLRAQAEQQLSKSKRQAELESAYKEALRALDAQEWQEAIKRLRRVRGLQAGYRESDSLLHRAESELERTRKNKVKPKAKTTVMKTVRLEWLILLMFASFSLSEFICELVLGWDTFEWLGENFNYYVSYAIYMSVYGALLGFALWWMLREAAIALTRSQILAIIITPSLALTVFTQVAFYCETKQGFDGWLLMYSVFGLALGLFLTMILRKTMPPFGRRQSLLTIFGWGIAFFIGHRMGGNLSYSLEQIIENTRVINLLAYSAEAGIAGLIGSLFTVGQFKEYQDFNLDWKTVLAASLGFGLGNLFVNILFTPLEEELVFTFLQLTIWGFLGGAALAFPSKSYKRYLFLGLLGSIGMMLGQLAWMALGEPDDLRVFILGAILGLCLGIGTKRIAGVLILSIIGAVAYTFRLIINSFYYNNYSTTSWGEFIVLALTAGLMGLILGAVWSFLTNHETNPIAKQDVQ